MTAISPDGKLVLFDIDGTILYTGGAGRRAMRRALLDIYGDTGPIKNFPFAGKTDPQIIMELMTLAGYTPRLVQQRMGRFWDRYLEHLRGEMSRAHDLKVFPGVAELIKTLHKHDGTVLGLLTGNIEGGARLKLEPAGLNSYFPVGAFGNDSADRNELPRIAVDRIKVQYGRAFHGGDVVIVGDTVADVDCARSFGARAVVVATGFQDLDELERSRPDVLLPDFEDTGKALDAILTSPS